MKLCCSLEPTTGFGANPWALLFDPFWGASGSSRLARISVSHEQQSQPWASVRLRVAANFHTANHNPLRQRGITKESQLRCVSESPPGRHKARATLQSNKLVQQFLAKQFQALSRRCIRIDLQSYAMPYPAQRRRVFPTEFTPGDRKPPWGILNRHISVQRDALALKRENSCIIGCGQQTDAKTSSASFSLARRIAVPRTAHSIDQPPF